MTNTKEAQITVAVSLDAAMKTLDAAILTLTITLVAPVEKRDEMITEIIRQIAYNKDAITTELMESNADDYLFALVDDEG
jgi:hypothetical protein